MNISELMNLAYQIAHEKGWHDKELSVGDRIALMHSELSEALEEYRKGKSVQEIYYSDDGKPEGLPVELADCVIRIFEFCELHNIDLEQAISIKMIYNTKRKYRHGGKVI